MKLLLNIFITLPVKIVLAIPITALAMGLMLMGYSDIGSDLMESFVESHF